MGKYIVQAYNIDGYDGVVNKEGDLANFGDGGTEFESDWEMERAIERFKKTARYPDEWEFRKVQLC